MKPAEHHGANPPRDKAKPAAPVKRPPGGEGLGAGDQVYVRHPKRGAIAVKVKAVGRDGFKAVDGEGLEHRVPHAHYLGHRARMLNRYRLVEQGADGALLEDSSGRRRFVAGEMVQPEEPAAPPSDDPLLGGMDRLEKAMQLPDGARALLLKAEPPDPKKKPMPKDGKKPAGKPGAKKPASGKGGGDFGSGGAGGAGGQPQGGAAPMQHGQRVRWQHGDVQGAGKIVSSGADGVTAASDDGREHQVRHEHLLGPDDGQQPGGQPAPGQQQPGGKPGAGGPPQPGQPGAAPQGAPQPRPPGQPMAPQAPGGAGGGMEAAAAKVGAAIGQALLLFFKQAGAGGGQPAPSASPQPQR